jgi:hypothetical protein
MNTGTDVFQKVVGGLVNAGRHIAQDRGMLTEGFDEFRFAGELFMKERVAAGAKVESIATQRRGCRGQSRG